ncbi:MAG: (d)CMP kinase, partial [Oscillospiraceae bacterium]
MKRPISISIDGPAAAGKSTLARALAERMGFLYVDTGALYRAVGYYVCMQGADPADAAQVVPLLRKISVLPVYHNGEQRMMLNGEDVSEAIRMPEMSMAASHVSAIPEVRAFLLELQRNLAREHSVVMD